MTDSNPVLFREVQRFRQTWLWLIVLIIPAVFIYGIVQQLVLDKPFGNNPVSDTTLIILGVVFGIGLPCLMYMVNLTTEVRSDSLYVRYFPFHFSFRKIPLGDVSSCEACVYSPLKEYGGWGIRYGRKGRAYNVSGNRGMQLEFANGKRLLIGSQKSEELVRAVTLALDGRSRS